MRVVLLIATLCMGKLGFSQLLHALDFKLTVSKELQSSFKPDGRLLLFFTKEERIEPMQIVFPLADSEVFGKNFNGVNPKKTLTISDVDGWMSTSDWPFEGIPEGTYYFQALWDHDLDNAGVHQTGNIYTPKQKIEVNGDMTITAVFSESIQEKKVIEHELVKFVNFKSPSLSEFWGRDIYLKASVLLPSNYNPEHDHNEYPIRYQSSGFGGDFRTVNYLMQNKEFADWWTDPDSPQIITVFLDGESPYGHSYHMDSENNGPYGHALVNELIPHIESLYRGTDRQFGRFLDGCSTGGWVSVGLQLYYPETFYGCYAYSPDALEFENYQLVNIYEDENLYYNEHGYLRPLRRDINGEPIWSMKEFIEFENVLSPTGDYRKSGGQFGSHLSLYSNKAEDGMPAMLFDPYTGEIDHEVAKTWEKYDFKKYAAENWTTLGPQLKGKVFISMGDMDDFYLNPGTRGFAEFIENTENPKSDARIEFLPMTGHCRQYSNRKVLEMIHLEHFPEK